MAHKGLKITCVAICCIALVSILVIPSFAVEDNSRAVSSVSPLSYYSYTGFALPSETLYYVDLDGSFTNEFTVYALNIRTGELDIIPRCTRVFFSNSAVTVVNLGEPYELNIVDCVIRFDFEGSFVGNVNELLGSLSTVDLYTYREYYDYGQSEYTSGESTGRNEGIETGRQLGYQEAVNDLTEGGTWSGLGDFFVNIIGSFTDAELFYGFTIGTILSLFVGAILFFWFIKLLR